MLIARGGARFVILAAVGFLIVSAYAAQAQDVSANGMCKGGNYAYDYRTKGSPCDSPDEKKKCRLNVPCFTFTDGVKTAIGICVAENECQGTMVKVCDEKGCRWEPPQRFPLPSAPAQPVPPYVDPHTLPHIGFLPEEYRHLLIGGDSATKELPLSTLYRNIVGDTSFSDMQKELFELGIPGKLPSDSADRTLLPADLLRNERFTLTAEWPRISQADINTATEEWNLKGESRATGSTFAEAQNGNEAEGPAIPVQRFTAEEVERERLLRNLPEFLTDWVRLGRQEIAETVRNWLATEIPGEWTTARAPSEQLDTPTMVVRTYTSISDVVTDAVRSLFGFEPLAPAQPLGEGPRTVELPQGITASELARLDKDAAATIAAGYYGPNEPDLYGRYMYSKINDPGHLDVLTFDDKGRALTISEPGNGPEWKINSPQGVELVEQIYGCTGACLERAYKDAESVEREAAEKADFEKCGEVPCGATYEDTEPKTPPPSPAPKTLEATPRPAPTTPSKISREPRKPLPTPTPRETSGPRIGRGSAGGSLPSAGSGSVLQSLMSALIQVLSNLLSWWNNSVRQQPPPPTPPTSPLPPATSSPAVRK